MDYRIVKKDAFTVVGLSGVFPYEIAEGYNIEIYTDVALYPNGNRDENYYSEIRIPVKKNNRR